MLKNQQGKESGNQRGIRLSVINIPWSACKFRGERKKIMAENDITTGEELLRLVFGKEVAQWLPEWLKDNTE